MKTYLIKIISISLFLILAVSCNSSKTSEKEVQEIENVNQNVIKITNSQFENSKMELGSFSNQNFSEGIKTNGFIDVPPANKASVSAIVGGYIKVSNLLIGDNVKKGQFLLSIENPDFIEIQQNYLEIFEQLSYLESEYERQKTLFEEKITSEKNYLKAESDYKRSKAIYNGLEQKLRFMNINPDLVKLGKITSVIPIYAPISGSITNVNTSVGKFMNASEILIEIIDSEHKHLELVVFEKDVLRVNEGQVIYFQTPENSLKSYKGEVHLIGKSIDEKNRTVKVHGHLENENEPFVVGMFVEAEIITNSTEKFALPINAVLEDGGNYFILVLKEKNENYFEFEKKSISIGLKNENWVEIIDAQNTIGNLDVLIKGAFIPLNESE